MYCDRDWSFFPRVMFLGSVYTLGFRLVVGADLWVTVKNFVTLLADMFLVTEYCMCLGG